MAYFSPDDRSGSSGAVRVEAIGLVHTEQTLPVDENGQLKGDSVADQFQLVCRDWMQPDNMLVEVWINVRN